MHVRASTDAMHMPPARDEKDAPMEWQNDAPPRDRPVVLLLKDLAGRFSAVVAEYEAHIDGFYNQFGQPIYHVGWAPMPPFPKESA
jgi:hypothetical protein